MKIDKLLDQFDCYSLCKKLRFYTSIDCLQNEVLIYGTNDYFFKVNTNCWASILLTLEQYEKINTSEEVFLRMVEEDYIKRSGLVLSEDGLYYSE